MVGDPHYMAPEQISGQGYGYGVDYWSLGILLYVILHGATPFKEDKTETQVWRLRAKCRSCGISFSVMGLPTGRVISESNVQAAGVFE